MTLDLVNWLKRLFGEVPPIDTMPNYRLGDFNEEELTVLTFALERAVEEQSRYASASISYEHAYKLTANLYLEAKKALNQTIMDGRGFKF
jgi:hypothetical protein